MGKIQIVVDDQGKISMASDFGQAETLLVLEKVKVLIVQGAPQPQTQRIIPATMVPRINGQLPGG